STNKELFFVTRKGTVKRTSYGQFENIRKTGVIAINLKENDELVAVRLTDGNKNMIIGTNQGYAVSFYEIAIRSMVRTAAGVCGISLREDDYVVGIDTLGEDDLVLVISETGYGKVTKSAEYAIRGRGGKEIKTFKITDRNGSLIGLS